MEMNLTEKTGVRGWIARRRVARMYRKKETSLQRGKKVSLVNGFTPVFSIFNGNPNNNDVFQSAVNSNARHISKLVMTALRDREASGETGADSARLKALNRLLQLRPNEQTSSAQFLKQAAYQYFTYGHCFIYLDKDNLGDLKAMWVISCMGIEIKTFDDGSYSVIFTLNGVDLDVSHHDILHLTRFADLGDLLDSQNKAIMRLIRIIDTNYQGIEKAIEYSNMIRFIVETTTVLTPQKKQEKAKAFTESYLSEDSDVNVIYSDANEKVTPVENKGKYEAAEGQKYWDAKVYSYLGTNEKIINGTFTEDEWQAFYESTVEPFANELQQEMTYKIFTFTELGHKNRIEINTSRLQTASLASRLKIAELVQKLPTYKPNTIMKLLYLPEFTEGDTPYMTLNYEPTGTPSDEKDDGNGSDKGNKDNGTDE